MKLQQVLKRTEKLVTDNSPTILTAIGVTGALTTAYLTGTASFKAADVIAKEQVRLDFHEKSHPLTSKEKAGLIWKLYIPPAASGVVTCAAIVGANRIGTRRAAAMAAAFTISERAYDEYKDKVLETIGKNKEQKVRDDVAQDRVNANPPNAQTIVLTGKGDMLFMDAMSMRPFESSMEDVKAAQNRLNHLVLNDGYASLTDFYNQLGLSSTKISDDLGWNSDKLMELTFSTTVTDDGRPCHLMDFNVAPIRNYFRVH